MKFPELLEMNFPTVMNDVLMTLEKKVGVKSATLLTPDDFISALISTYCPHEHYCESKPEKILMGLPHELLQFASAYLDIIAYGNYEFSPVADGMRNTANVLSTQEYELYIHQCGALLGALLVSEKFS